MSSDVKVGGTNVRVLTMTLAAGGGELTDHTSTLYRTGNGTGSKLENRRLSGFFSARA